MPIDALEPEQTVEQRRIAQLESELALTRAELKHTQQSLERLREQYTRALEQLQLARRRLFVAKSERVDSKIEQLTFERLLGEVEAIEKALDAAEGNDGPSSNKGKGKGDKRKTRTSPPTGRRDLADTSLPVRRVEITDPELEGKVARLRFEETSRLGYERGGMRRIVVARAVYKLEGTIEQEHSEQPQGSAAEPVAEVTPVAEGACSAPADTTFRTAIAPLPKELMARGMLVPSMIAHVLVAKYVMGLPFYRLEQRFAFEGVSLDRGTMCRYAEHIGATLGAIVEAARQEAIATAFCLSTDATGVAIQPAPLDDGTGQPCRKGHFFVTLADCDHIFFDYQPKHTSAAVWQMFKGYSGYVQADAHAVYDALFRGVAPKGVEDDGTRAPPPTEVGCWSHARRGFWEAAVCKYTVGVDGLRRINAVFEADRKLADLPPVQKKLRRDTLVKPLVDDFFAWAKAEQTKVDRRGLVATALGYAIRQEPPLRAFLNDGRLRLDNNAAERALRNPIAIGRKAWLFFGSDDHAHAAANLFSLLACCKLHRLDPEDYLRDVIRVMPYWPRERYLELAPKYWAATRARLHHSELDRPLGHVTVPPPRSAQEQQPTG